MRSRLGRTGLEVSKVCLGTWQLGGGWGDTDVAAARRTILGALDLGIDFIDTAAAYGWGRSETFLAEALGATLQTRRHELVIATKGGLRMDGPTLVRDSSPAALRTALEASLRALRTDYVDVYLVHWPDPAIPIEETAGVLDSFVREGLVRFVGASNIGVDDIAAFEATRPLDVVQPPYAMVRRGIEAELLPRCLAEDIGVMTYGPLVHGLLADARIDRTRDDDWRAASHVFVGADHDRVVRSIPALRAIAADAGISLAQLAVAWAARHPAVSSVIVGARHLGHLEAAVGAVDAVVPTTTWSAVDAIVETLPDLDVASPENL